MPHVVRYRLQLVAVAPLYNGQAVQIVNQSLVPVQFNPAVAERLENLASHQVQHLATELNRYDRHALTLQLLGHQLGLAHIVSEPSQIVLSVCRQDRSTDGHQVHLAVRARRPRIANGQLDLAQRFHTDDHQCRVIVSHTEVETSDEEHLAVGFHAGLQCDARLHVVWVESVPRALDPHAFPQSHVPAGRIPLL